VEYLLLKLPEVRMNVGMLWFDNDTKSDFKMKIKRAAAYYQNKYGQQPNLCYVHPNMLEGESLKTDGIEIRTTRSVLPHHFWIGVYTEPPLPAASSNGKAVNEMAISSTVV
jgi:hypothetical protein